LQWLWITAYFIIIITGLKNKDATASEEDQIEQRRNMLGTRTSTLSKKISVTPSIRRQRTQLRTGKSIKHQYCSRIEQYSRLTDVNEFEGMGRKQKPVDQ